MVKEKKIKFPDVVLRVMYPQYLLRHWNFVIILLSHLQSSIKRVIGIETRSCCLRLSTWSDSYESGH